MGVWIETIYSAFKRIGVESHPVWVCGLKLIKYLITQINNTSHPVWVCGLKH